MEWKILWLLLSLHVMISPYSASSSDEADSPDTDDCITLCPCFTSLDITEACMSLPTSCLLTDTLPIQREILCGENPNNTFAVLPFTNECVRGQQQQSLNEEQLSICLSILSVSAAVFGCDINVANSCPLDRNFTESTIADPAVEFDNDDTRSITSTIGINIDPLDVEGLTLVDIVISVAIEHTRIGDVLATLSHDTIMDHPLFGNDVVSVSHCGHDNIFVTITDNAVLPSSDLMSATCEDSNGDSLNGGAALGFGGERGVIGFGGTRLPLQPLSVFIDQDVTNINGDWILTLTDGTDTNIGYFGAWEITFVYVNDQVHDICESEIAARLECCGLNDENGALCDVTEAYCKSAACLIARDNADNVETVIQSMFELIDIRCSIEE